MASDTIQEFEALMAEGSFVFAVYYRGHWCPFCISYLRSLVALMPSITAAGGKTVIITAESEIHLQDVRSATGYAGAAISDPEHLLATELKRRNLLDVAISKRKGYENGMAQPAVLAMKSDGTVLESWAINPGMMNMGGASDRPLLKQLWENVEAQLNGKPPLHSNYPSTGMMRLLMEKMCGPPTPKA